MKIKLTHTFAPNTSVDEADVRQVKKVLNRLGYYMPYAKTGITGTPDSEMFAGLKAFQRDHGLKATGAMKPGDETETALNVQNAKDQSGEYIWHTVDDDKVRAEHAELNGTKRQWNDSPDPGEDFNCRCWAEPVAEGLHQEIVSEVNDVSPSWTWDDFVKHFYSGGGRELSLEEVGHLQNMIDQARTYMFKRLEDQIKNTVQENDEGPFEYKTSNNYEWPADIVWVFGKGTIRTYTKGNILKQGNLLIVEAKIDYEYDDVFTDPANRRQRGEEKTSDPEKVLDERVRKTDFYGRLYPILGWWQTELTGSISKNK